MKKIPSLLGAVCLALTAMVVVPATGASATTSLRIDHVNAPGVSGSIDLDGASPYCVQHGGARYGYEFDGNGNVSIPGGGNTMRCDSSSAQDVRAEVYPATVNSECSTPGPNPIQSINPFQSPAGGMHLHLPSGANIGTLTLPMASTGGIKPVGKLLRASGPNPSCTIHLDLFQNEGFALGGRGAFNAFYANHNDDVTMGWIFAGDYTLFIEDEMTGTKVRIQTSFDASTRFDIDADASCFGFDNCAYLTGAPPATGGGFHPLTPARILDTRSNVGIVGKVNAGDGSLPLEPNPDMRRDQANNHQTKVTGVGGVPEHGVSAVLLNVTVTGAEADSWLAAYPKLPHQDVFYDQSWFRSGPGTSNLNFKAGQTLPNLVLARVGAGGRIMLENYAGNVHVIADVVGWVDTGSGGDGFTGITPARLLDTRQSTQGPIFGPNETRHLTVTGVNDVPADATAVVLNVTQIDATTAGYMTVYPTGIERPNTSNLNGAPGRTRPNLVVSKVGTGGQVDIYNYDGKANVAVDIVGYFSPRGGRIYSISPNRIMDSRSGFGSEKTPFDAKTIRNLTVVGGSVPANATAVILNVTGTQSTYGSFLTLFPAGDKLPTTSNVNLELGDPAPNLVMMRIGTNGQISIYNDRGLAHVIVDVMGYVA